MPEEKISQKLGLINIDEIRNYFIKEMNQKELTIKKNKKVCRALTCIEHLHIGVSTVTGFVSISAFASLFGIPIRITNSAAGLKFFAITVWIKKYKLIINKKKKKHDKIVLVAKSKLNSIEVLISKSLITLNISHDNWTAQKS